MTTSTASHDSPKHQFVGHINKSAIGASEEPSPLDKRLYIEPNRTDSPQSSYPVLSSPEVNDLNDDSFYETGTEDNLDAEAKSWSLVKPEVKIEVEAKDKTEIGERELEDNWRKDAGALEFTDLSGIKDLNLRWVNWKWLNLPDGIAELDLSIWIPLSHAIKKNLILLFHVITKWGRKGLWSDGERSWEKRLKIEFRIEKKTFKNYLSIRNLRNNKNT